jgi:hypothetical protein
MGGLVLRREDPRGSVDRSQRSTGMIYLNPQVLYYTAGEPWERQVEPAGWQLEILARWGQTVSFDDRVHVVFHVPAVPRSRICGSTKEALFI